MRLKIACVLFLLAVLAAGRVALATAPPDPALARKLCEESRKDAAPEIRTLCVPKEFAATARIQLLDMPGLASKENGSFVYMPTGSRVMAWDPSPQEFTPQNRAYYIWLEWQGKIRMVPRKALLPVPFKVEPALVIQPSAAVFSSSASGPTQTRLGLGAIISVARPPESPDGAWTNKLIVIENGDTVGIMWANTVKIGVQAISPPEKRYATLPAVVVKNYPEAKAQVVKTVPYGSTLEVYAGPPEILKDGFLPVVEAGKTAGYVLASEVSASVPSVDDFMTAILKQMGAAEFKLAAGISETAGEKYSGNADFYALRKALGEEQTPAKAAPLVVTLGPFQNLSGKPVVTAAALDAGALRKSFQEQYASKQYQKAVATARVLGRLGKNNMQPLKTDTALYYACRGDFMRAKDVTITAGATVPPGTDWCISRIDLDGPCEPCADPPMDFEPDEDSTDAEIAAGEAEVAADHYNNHVLPVQEEIERYQAWKKNFQQAVPPSPKLRLRFENLLDDAMPAQSAFLYHYTYSYPVENQFSVGEGVRGGVQVHAITIPALGPRGSAELWVDVPRYETSVYGVVFAQDERAAGSTVESSPLPQPAIDARPPDFQPPVAPQRIKGAAIPGECSTPARACVCWRQ